MPGRSLPVRVVDRCPPAVLLVGAGATEYVGAAVAVGLFALMPATAVAWWRVAVAALVLLAWRRPWHRRADQPALTRHDLLVSAFFGLIIVAMNTCFYQALRFLPLGSAVSLEFVGPVVVAVLRGRGWRPRVAAVFAMAGVAAIGGLSMDLHAPETLHGLAWISGSALMWGSYIVIGSRVTHHRSGITSLAIGLPVAAVFSAPFLASAGMVAFQSPWLLVQVVLVGILSTVVPFSLEAIAMGKLSAETYALMNALLPATSAMIGLVFLHQIPSVWEGVGLVLVSFAVWLASTGQR